MFIATCLLSVSISFLIAYWWTTKSKIHRNGKSLRKPPNTLPLAGNGLLFLKARHKLFSWFVKCERQFGYETFQISVPTLPPGVVINDPKNLEFVLKSEGIFAKGDFFKRRSWDLFGNGIINADGDLWKVQRKAGLSFLSNSNLKILTDVALPRYLKEMMVNLKTASASSTVVDLEAEVNELMTKLMGRMAYDMEMHAGDTFSMAFDYASGMTGERFQNPLWPITERLLASGRRFRSSIATVKNFGGEIVENAVESRSEKTKSEANSMDCISGTLINSLLDSIDDHQMVADAALNYLSAGRDTTAQALTWAFYLLMRHPKVVEEIRDELQSVSQSSTSTSGEPTFHPSTLPYTLAVFYETIRLYPPVPFELKQCTTHTTLPDGTFLPRNAVLVWCTWAMNRSYLTWGNDADSFKPDRWLKDGVIISRPAWEYPVFNGGPRTCLGRKMAENVAVQVLAGVVGNLDLRLAKGEEVERRSRNSLTLPMEGGLPCTVEMRREMVD